MRDVASSSQDPWPISIRPPGRRYASIFRWLGSAESQDSENEVPIDILEAMESDDEAVTALHLQR